MSNADGLGKRCPTCGEPMTNLTSLNLRQCATGCKQSQEWSLGEGQKPLITNNRHDRSAK